MNEINSTATPAPRKPCKPDAPEKPHKDFPLFPAGNGQWCKKVLGKPHYFGKWQDDPKGIRALDRWLAEKDDLLAGRVPRTRGGAGPTLGDLCNRFRTTKTNNLDPTACAAILRQADRQAAKSEKELPPALREILEKRALAKPGGLSVSTWASYGEICDHLISAFGRDRLLTDILSEDFEKLRNTWAAKWGPSRLGSEMNRARVVFNYGYKNGLLDKPMRYGEGFKRPSKKTMRLNKAAGGPKMFEADELRQMIDAATQPMKAMLLLAINAGLGNNDIAMLPTAALDLKTGWMMYPRPKTGVNRRCPLWPETVKALRAWLADRPTPADEADAELVFLTVRGNSWAKDSADRPISHECRKLLDKLKINGSRNFYAIRHSFETIGGDSRDQIAVNAIMGHEDGSMASTYRERIEDDRLQAVVAHVRAWLFATKKKK